MLRPLRTPASYPVGTRETFRVVKRLEREADQSSPSGTDLKNAWSYTSTPLINLHDVVLN